MKGGGYQIITGREQKIAMSYDFTSIESVRGQSTTLIFPLITTVLMLTLLQWSYYLLGRLSEKNTGGTLSNLSRPTDGPSRAFGTLGDYSMVKVCYWVRLLSLF